jgi:hypothetical protein
MSNWIEVQNALGRWAWGYDEFDLELFVDALTKDATVKLETAKGIVTEMAGHEEIRAFYGDRLAKRPPGVGRRHVTTPVSIDERDGEAIVLSYLLLYIIADDVPRLVTTGWYRDRVVDDGDAWRIAARHIYLDVVQLPKP